MASLASFLNLNTVDILFDSRIEVMLAIVFFSANGSACNTLY